MPEDVGEGGDRLLVARRPSLAGVGHAPQEFEEALGHDASGVASREFLHHLENFTGVVRECDFSGALDAAEEIVELFLAEVPRQRREQIVHVVLHLLERVGFSRHVPEDVEVLGARGALLKQPPQNRRDLVDVLLVVEVHGAKHVRENPLGFQPLDGDANCGGGVRGVQPRGFTARPVQHGVDLAERRELRVERGHPEHTLHHRAVRVGDATLRLAGADARHQQLARASKRAADVGVVSIARVAAAADESVAPVLGQRLEVRQRRPRRLLQRTEESLLQAPRAPRDGSNRNFQEAKRHHAGVAHQHQHRVETPGVAETVDEVTKPTPTFRRRGREIREIQIIALAFPRALPASALVLVRVSLDAYHPIVAVAVVVRPSARSSSSASRRRERRRRIRLARDVVRSGGDARPVEDESRGGVQLVLAMERGVRV